MTAKSHYVLLLVFVTMIAFGLACTLSGPGTTEPANTPAPFVTATPVSAAQNVPTPKPGATLVPPSNTPPAPTVPPTNTPTATATQIIGSGPNGCVLQGTYIADVTIPDGTLFAPGAPFRKTWRIRNDGTCQWDANYRLVFAEGSQMSGPAAVTVPAAAPGQIVDISVDLIAPGATGDFAARWRLQASNGAIFGGYTVVIKVAGTPTPTSTVTPTPIGGGTWGGLWDTDCAGSACAQMSLVQSGNTVAGTYAGGGGVINGTVTGNRLTGTWTRGGVTGTFDFWIEGSGLRWHGNWNKSQKWCGYRSGQTPLTPCGVSTWYGAWTTNCEGSVPCGDMTLTQVGDTVTGSYFGGAGVISGTVANTKLTGTWTRNPGSPSSTSGTFQFFMSDDGLQFRGNYNTTFFWCGFRAGSSLPSPCLNP